MSDSSEIYILSIFHLIVLKIKCLVLIEHLLLVNSNGVDAYTKETIFIFAISPADTMTQSKTTETSFPINKRGIYYGKIVPKTPH